MGVVNKVSYGKAEHLTSNPLGNPEKSPCGHAYNGLMGLLTGALAFGQAGTAGTAQAKRRTIDS